MGVDDCIALAAQLPPKLTRRPTLSVRQRVSAASIQGAVAHIQGALSTV